MTDLRAVYPAPGDRAVRKVLGHLDTHGRRFVALSPFVVLATSSADGRHDASPRGGAGGFVRVVDDRTLWLPDATGNNRLDSLSNVAETGRIGLLFLIPGVDETLRVNGAARIRTDLGAVGSLEDERVRSVLEVGVEEAFLHCAKALMRSRLWDTEAQRDRSALAPTSVILNDHAGIARSPETRDQMEARYRPDL